MICATSGSRLHAAALLALLGIAFGFGGESPAAAQRFESILHTFNTHSDGVNPNAPLLRGIGGIFYGITQSGGTNGDGTIYKVTSNGTLITLHSFTSQDGFWPEGRLVQAANGTLYGATFSNTIFRMAPDGSGFQVLHQLNYVTEGSQCVGGLVVGHDGSLYGCTYNGGPGGHGTVFKMSVNGTTFTLLHAFTNTSPDGGNPSTAPIQASDGSLYGAATVGGPSGNGIVYRTSSDGSAFTVLYGFPAGTIANPKTLILSHDRTLIGTTANLSSGSSAIFSLGRDGANFSVLHDFTFDGIGVPSDPLIQGSDGTLYGSTKALFGSPNYGAVFRIAVDGSNFAALHRFTQSDPDDAAPSGLIEGFDGRLYGTTSQGGPPRHVGSIFAVATTGAYTPVFQFTNGFVDGKTPAGNLIEDRFGNHYGVTLQGGGTDDGTLFKISAAGVYSQVHVFNGNDGHQPSEHLVMGPDGALYGTTAGGGFYDDGVIFRVNTDGSGFTLLRSFAPPDGEFPNSGLTLGRRGLLYGTTSFGEGNLFFGALFSIHLDGSGFTVLAPLRNVVGGVIQATDGRLYGASYDGQTDGNGLIFRIDPDGSGYTVLHSFGVSDGALPANRLLQGADGSLYGATTSGGRFGAGTLFRIQTDGLNFGTVHDFSTSESGGEYTDLIQDSSGNLYGGTQRGGAHNAGTIFEVNPIGSSFNLIYQFAGPITDGAYPSGIAEGADGNLYGATTTGGIPPAPGIDISGTAFRLNVRLPMITGFSPFMGPVGTTVTVTGVNLGHGHVSIGGIVQPVLSSDGRHLVFKVAAQTPSGMISITTANGATSSRTSFYVTH